MARYSKTLKREEIWVFPHPLHAAKSLDRILTELREIAIDINESPESRSSLTLPTYSNSIKVDWIRFLVGELETEERRFGFKWGHRTWNSLLHWLSKMFKSIPDNSENQYHIENALNLIDEGIYFLEEDFSDPIRLKPRNPHKYKYRFLIRHNQLNILEKIKKLGANYDVIKHPNPKHKVLYIYVPSEKDAKIIKGVLSREEFDFKKYFRWNPMKFFI